MDETIIRFEESTDDERTVANKPAETNALGVVDLANHPGSTSWESFGERAFGSDAADPESRSVGYSYLMQLIKVAAPLWLADLIVICLLYTSPSPRD